MTGDFILSVSSQMLARIRNDQVVTVLSRVLEDLVRGKNLPAFDITLRRKNNSGGEGARLLRLGRIRKYLVITVMTRLFEDLVRGKN